MKHIEPVHPGEHLAEFLEEFAITPYRLAKDISVDPTRIGEIVNCRRAITADTALRLGRFFNTSANFWTNLQTNYDLEIAQLELGDRLDKEVKPHAA